VNTLQNQASPARPAAGGPAARASDAERDHIAGPVARASDAERDHAAGLISEAFAEGRLTAAEHAQRLDAAYAARTQAQLHLLLADLPASAPVPSPAPGPLTGADRCLLCVLSCLCPLVAIAWWLRSRRRPPRCPDRPLPAAAGPDGGWLRAQDGPDAQGQ
jgi:DUF1707 SHOCT-like domain